MKKEELIQLHTEFVQLKRYFEDNFDRICEKSVGDFFSKYDALKIKPHYVHKSKKEHYKALYILGSEIVNLMNYLQSQDGVNLCMYPPRRSEKPPISVAGFASQYRSPGLINAEAHV